MDVKELHSGIAHSYMVEVGPREFLDEQLPLDPWTIEPQNEPLKIRYHVMMRCVSCGESGIFDQDRNAVEYHQAATVDTCSRCFDARNNGR